MPFLMSLSMTITNTSLCDAYLNVAVKLLSCFLANDFHLYLL